MQNIMIDQFGRPVSAYKDDNAIDLASMGRQSIRRFSEVLFDEEAQRFYVTYRDTAPESMQGTDMTEGHHLAGIVVRDNQTPGPAIFDYVLTAFTERATFDTYASAVAAEQLVLAWLMKDGSL